MLEFSNSRFFLLFGERMLSSAKGALSSFSTEISNALALLWAALALKS